MAYVEGEVLLDGENLYAPRVDPVNVRRRSAWSSSSPTRSRRCRSRENVLAGLKLNNRRIPKESDGRRRRRAGAARREPVERGQGPPRQPRLGPVGRPAAAPVHRPRDRGASPRCC